MQTSPYPASIEDQIHQWRNHLLRRQANHSADVARLENELRKHVADLVSAGLANDEAFLVAVKRMGKRDELSREFARAHSGRLWKEIVLAPTEPGALRLPVLGDAIVAFCLAVAAAIAFKLPALFGVELNDKDFADTSFYVRNLSLFVLPLLTVYFAWKRRLDVRTFGWLAVAFVAAGVFANIYPFAQTGSTLGLTALHLPIALWLVVGVAYAGDRWARVDGRMDFIRFSGELFIYYVLIALGGGVLTGLMAMIFQAIGIDVERFVGEWLLPCGAAGAVLVASWLVESKQGVMQNLAPMLTRVFTPLFAAVLIVFLGALLWTGRGIRVEREALIVFDLLLVVVVGLVLYAVSDRDPQAPAGAFDVVQVVLILGAMLADAVALWAIAARINEFGFTPNRVAALGENVILLVHLGWTAVLYLRFLRGRGSFATLEKWQTDYLPVYGAWATLVVIVFPPLFKYI